MVRSPRRSGPVPAAAVATAVWQLAASAYTLPAQQPAQPPRPSAGATALPPAAGAPNFSGVWALDSARTDFGPLTPGGAHVLRVRHAGAAFDLEVGAPPGGGVTRSTRSYRIGGPAVVTQGAGGPSRRRATWEGRELVVVDASEAPGLEFVRTERWRLGPGAGTLTVARTITSPHTETRRMRLVFTRQ